MSQFTYDLSNLDLPLGTYDIFVKAKADDFLDSESSNVVEYSNIVPEGSYLTFHSPDEFTIHIIDHTKYWDGKLEYSTNLRRWAEWDATETLTSGESDGVHYLYLRGTNNTILKGFIEGYHFVQAGWVFTGSDIDCEGNIETLLDYNTVVEGGHPEMGERCFAQIFINASQLISVPELPATTLSYGCYSGLFQNCTNITSAPVLPATQLTEACYSSMFEGCTSLVNAPELPAMTLTDSCYLYMFAGCTSLTTAPELPATTLAANCYWHMFNNCTSLVTVPDLPATTLFTNSYRSMFNGCSSITTAPALSANSLGEWCYAFMFYNCTSLENAPSLPATTLSPCCYNSMFVNCTSLESLPELPATTLVSQCYERMFEGCTGIKLSATKVGDYRKAFRIPTTGTGTLQYSSAVKNMFKNTGGTFTDSPEINTTYYLWKEIVLTPCLTFSSETGTFTLKGSKRWDGTLEASVDGETWTQYTGAETSSSVDSPYTLYLRGSNNTRLSDSVSGSGLVPIFVLTGANIRCSGNIESLLDYEDVAQGLHPTVTENCFAGLFGAGSGASGASGAGNANLISAPDILLESIPKNGCHYTFCSNSALSSAPRITANNIGVLGLSGMFTACSNISGELDLTQVTSIDEEGLAYFSTTYYPIIRLGTNLTYLASQDFYTTSANKIAIRYEFTDNDTPQFDVNNAVGQYVSGSSTKGSIAWKVYTDNTAIKNAALAKADSKTTVEVFHLDGSEWSE